jgi:hypothetical protein
VFIVLKQENRKNTKHGGNNKTGQKEENNPGNQASNSAVDAVLSEFM